MSYKMCQRRKKVRSTNRYSLSIYFKKKGQSRADDHFKSKLDLTHLIDFPDWYDIDWSSFCLISQSNEINDDALHLKLLKSQKSFSYVWKISSFSRNLNLRWRKKWSVILVIKCLSFVFREIVFSLPLTCLKYFL